MTGNSKESRLKRVEFIRVNFPEAALPKADMNRTVCNRVTEALLSSGLYGKNMKYLSPTSVVNLIREVQGKRRYTSFKELK